MKGCEGSAAAAGSCFKPPPHVIPSPASPPDGGSGRGGTGWALSGSPSNSGFSANSIFSSSTRGYQASSGVTIDLSPAAEKIRERDQVILWWTTLLNSIVERVHDAESWWEYPVEFGKEIMEDVTAHPDPGSFFRKTLDTVTELRLLLLLLLGSMQWFDCLQRFFLTFLRYNVQALLPGSLMILFNVSKGCLGGFWRRPSWLTIWPAS
ncbi:uncharacterized protein LOC128345376 [Hemicordylus capensis]|uniref:uncharacterized protein LOC128345376 n=1 Tax=Hemicordylus capensis TaxID=884348 RepID=UPI0023022361|nr:uncharacterized protein LOC128345376 [Hemicordylus capensis]